MVSYNKYINKNIPLPGIFFQKLWQLSGNMIDPIYKILTSNLPDALSFALSLSSPSRYSFWCSLQVIAVMGFSLLAYSFLNFGQSHRHLCAHFSWLRLQLKCHLLPETLEPPRLISLAQALPAPSTLPSKHWPEFAGTKLCNYWCVSKCNESPWGQALGHILTAMGASCVEHRWCSWGCAECLNGEGHPVPSYPRVRRIQPVCSPISVPGVVLARTSPARGHWSNKNGQSLFCSSLHHRHCRWGWGGGCGMTASVITYELSASLCLSVPQPSPQGYKARRRLVQQIMAYTGCYEVGRHCIGEVHSGSWAAWHQCSAQICTQEQHVQQNSESRGSPALQTRSQSPRHTAL